MSDEVLTIQITAAADFIPADSVVAVLGRTLDILGELDAEISHKRRGTLQWRISKISLSSPLVVSIFPEKQEEPDIGHHVLHAFTRGLKQIEDGAQGVPSYFTEAALDYAKRLVSVLNDGIAEVTFSTSRQERVAPTQRVAANVDVLLHRQVEGDGYFEGTLEMLSIHHTPTFNLYDVLTGEKITCYFSREKLEEAKQAFACRVAVSGKAKYTRSGRPISVQVEQIRRLRDRKDLPQAKDLEGINITGGVEPERFVRSLRDAE